MAKQRDLEDECWDAHDEAKTTSDLPNRLKALDLLVKIRLSGERVKGEKQKQSASNDVDLVTRELNGDEL